MMGVKAMCVGWLERRIVVVCVVVVVVVVIEGRIGKKCKNVK